MLLAFHGGFETYFFQMKSNRLSSLTIYDHCVYVEMCRGLLIDTSRHYLSVSSILNQIEALSATKVFFIFLFFDSVRSQHVIVEEFEISFTFCLDECVTLACN
jgi:hypothetical protein